MLSLLGKALDVVKAVLGLKPGQPKKGRRIDVAHLPPRLCRGCKSPILPRNHWMADGCPCATARGVNHGLVSASICTCAVCQKVRPS